MGLHTGPKDGDYARYVEFLTSGTGGEPGKVYSSKSAKPGNWSLESEAPPLPDGFIADPSAMRPNPLVPANQAAARQSSQHAPTHPTTQQGAAWRGSNQTTTRGPTLAEQSRRRALSAIFMLVALFVGLSGIGTLLMTAMTAPVLAPEVFIPGIFLLVFAWMLFRGARGLRAQANGPTQALPPLTTLSNRQSSK